MSGSLEWPSYPAGSKSEPSISVPSKLLYVKNSGFTSATDFHDLLNSETHSAVVDRRVSHTSAGVVPVSPAKTRSPGSEMSNAWAFTGNDSRACTFPSREIAYSFE